jgi:hypothetical protein
MSYRGTSSRLFLDYATPEERAEYDEARRKTAIIRNRLHMRCLGRERAQQRAAQRPTQEPVERRPIGTRAQKRA